MARSEIPNVLGLPQEIGDLAALSGAISAALDKVIAEPDIRDLVGRGTTGNPITIQRVPTGAEAAEKLVRNVTNAGEDWVKGIQRPKDSFKSAALAANGKWKQRTSEAIAQDRFSKGMQATNEDEAIRTALKIGGAGLVAGVTARVEKIARVMGEIMPMIGAVSEAVSRLPQDTDQQREARMVGNLRGMRDIGKKRRGG